MTKELLLLRHGDSPFDTEHDFDRSLSHKGIQDTQSVADFCQDQNYIPDIIVASAAYRTTQSAQSYLEQLGKPISLETEKKLYNGTINDYVTEIKKRLHSYDRLLCVGHNPTLHELVMALSSHDLTSEQYALRRKLTLSYPPATLTVFDISDDLKRSVIKDVFFI